ncbi:metallophosphoesterase [bacterium]|nr:metallophosphoesterase [bacterium]
MSFTALHIGDLHFWRFPRNPMALFGKRILGVGNLALNRARKFHIHRGVVLVERMMELHADWMLFSGDFTTTALKSEYRAALAALSVLDEKLPGRIRAVPGNHDRYTGGAIRSRTFESHLSNWCDMGTWPHYSDLGDGVWLAGLDATTKNGLTGSFGRVPKPQIDALAHWLSENAANVRELWLLCHFPAEDPPGVLKHDRGIQLYNTEPLLQLLGGLDIPVLYLHGHHHYRWVYRSSAQPNITYLNGGAPLMIRHDPNPDLGFTQLLREDGQTRMRLHTYSVEEEVWSQVDVPEPAPGEYRNLQKAAAQVAQEIS